MVFPTKNYYTKCIFLCYKLRLLFPHASSTFYLQKDQIKFMDAIAHPFSFAMRTRKYYKPFRRIPVIFKKSTNDCRLHSKVSSGICHPCTSHTMEALVQLLRLSCLREFSLPGFQEMENWPATFQSDGSNCETCIMSVQVNTCNVCFGTSGRM